MFITLDWPNYQDGFDVVIAALNAVKGAMSSWLSSCAYVYLFEYLGTPMKQDILSITQGEKRIFSYMSQTLGLMADLDLGKLSVGV